MEKRRFRKKSRESTSSSTPRNSVTLGNSQEQSWKVLSLVNFNSETLSSSSPMKPDKVKMTNVRRKKIRSTQDFNQLSNSVTSPDSDASIKSEPKKSKRVKDTIYALPKIDKLTEDPFSVKENKSPDIFLNDNVLQRTEEKRGKIVLRKRRKTSNKNKEGVCVISQEATEINEEKSRNKKGSQTGSSGEHSIDSAVYENNGDSDVEIIYKKKQRKKHSVTKSDKHYIKRIKNMLLNNCEFSNEAVNQDCDNISSENRESGQKRQNVITKNIKNEEENGNRNYMNISAHLPADELNEPGKYVKSRTNSSILKTKSLMSTSPVSLSKIKEVKQDKDKLCLDFETAKSQEDISYISDLVDSGDSDNVFDVGKSVVVKGQTGQLVDIKKHPRKSVRFALLTSPKEISDRRLTFDLDQCSNGLKLFNSTLDKSLPELTQDKGITSKGKCQNIDCDKVSEYETDTSIAMNDWVVKDSNLNGNCSSKQLSSSPKLKSMHSIESLLLIHDRCPDTEVKFKETSVSRSTAGLQNNTDYDDADMNVKRNFKASRRSCVNTTNRESIIDLTTPENNLLPSSFLKPCRQPTFCKENIDDEIWTNSSTKAGNLKIIPENNAARNNSNVNIETQILPIINRTYSFAENDINDVSQNIFMNVKDEQSLIDLLTPSDKKLCNNSDLLSEESKKEFDSDKNKTDKTPRSAPLPKLSRAGTFTKKDRDNTCIKNLPDVTYSSPVLFGSPSNKYIDTSKVTKRRQWNKSQLSMSFLENSLDIGNISAPWEGNDTFENSKANNDTSQVLGLDLNSKVYKNGGRTPPSSTSTPLPVHKSNLLKTVLLKEKNVNIDESKNLNKICKPAIKPTRTKMPNFALIHQRAYDKMESLKEMSERKALRAKQLLSGCKPESTSNISSSKSRKFLQFSPVKSKAVPLNTSAKFNESGKKNVTNIPNISITKVKNITPLNKSVKLNESGKKNVTNMSNISITKVKNITPSKSNPKVVNKEDKLTPIGKKKELLKAKSRIPTKVPNNVLSEKQGFTRYGFKVGAKDVKKTTKEEQMKAVANKTKVLKNTVEERRNVIQGVRSNRRFELLMGLRKK